MIQLPPDFKDFLRLLNANKVEYLLIGGYAVGYHGYPRATIDLDIWIAINSENASRIIKTIHDFGFDNPEITENLFLDKDKIVRMGHPPLRIEIMTGISGVEFKACYDDKIIMKIEDVDVNLISLKHLKENKKAANRHKDLDDLEHLS